MESTDSTATQRRPAAMESTDPTATQRKPAPNLMSSVEDRRSREHFRLWVCALLSAFSFVAAFCFLINSHKALPEITLKLPFGTKLPGKIETWIPDAHIILYPAFILIMHFLPNKRPVALAILKFVVSLFFPALCYKTGTAAQGEPCYFFFLLLSATSIVFVMLIYRATEDFGLTDLLVAMAMAFCVASDGDIIWWQAALAALPASIKAFIPFLLKLFDYGSGFDEDEIRKNWRINGIEPEELAAFLQKLRPISEALNAVRDIERRGSEILQHINELESRLPRARD